MHPRDWANPGRLKVELFDPEGNPKNPNIKNSKIIAINIYSYRKATL